ncbi:nitrite reductase [Photobacterium kishitanii]|uniref:Nitrite reductase large subunit n=1 Tax=Photobacterium kishitanii TaxID=318456 RepID=A0AAX0YYM2_9GAMM|nr:nitrite reductase large subunit NirB [Photobacterium kishitanii]KJG62756.1 nitrite reductase [Photobacterium kishitanii]KJG66647.1 nitrite reductase [Photobacterium kishitanii]KJG70998.1 nitrite reductase [Photobacterium kishitanii]PSX21402.1 nitrite reductase large subunit [Photobacterium kishitanii]PSX30204.1 nitrite reductase large subunit [Photobacterium kishitanii]
MDRKRIVIVGNGMVGHHFIEQVLVSDGADGIDLVTFSEEDRLAYDRVQLSHYFNDKTAADLALAHEADYQQAGVSYHINQQVTAIDREHKYIITEQGKKITYDQLILATGSYPFVPPIAGNDAEHCHVYRTINDLKAIAASGKQSRVGVVIGGGLLGLEAANALQNMALETHVVEFAPQLMAVQLDEGGGALLRQKIEALGVNVHTSKATEKIVTGDQCRYKLIFADGTELDTDMVVFSAGIRPQDALAKQAGLTIGERGGIVINDQCQTSDADIYAIGECALWNNRIFGLVAPGYKMARVAASTVCGIDAAFTGADMSTKLKLLGVDVASIGEVHNVDASQVFTLSNDIEQSYQRIIVSEQGDKLLGAVLVGNVEQYSQLLQLTLNQSPLPTPPSLLLMPEALAATTQMTAVDDVVGDKAPVCSCFDVNKGQICQAVADGCVDMAQLKTMTKASTGCGGCASFAKQILETELAALGHQVNHHLCEHFSYSRQQLADIIRVKKIKTFSALLTEYGSGLGCDICKPAISSILASFWNDYILEPQHVGLQDTNDIYLGNMQKDGTYSVVPRIPAGEITPEKLIILGQVAQQFKLYTKITGGQRIDLFGAQLHQLPQIWRLLVDAGFETGHAYGKSVRTVKSCVGSTWCRYGMADSMAFAIDLENRYKGLRSPHKLKFAVSGCTRECAEAQSKDIGVIATEKGWNLYVAGNGGMRPRHGDLFASDLDNDTLISYIDRILMFYIRTADRLQRTSVWLENLEGGIDYLRQVVIDDALDINAELEQEMASSLSNYQCEWKTTLESPQELRRFQHFINSRQPDLGLAYHTVRQQRTPMTWPKSGEPITIVNITE